MSVDIKQAGRELDALVAEKVMGWCAEMVRGEGWSERRLYKFDRGEVVPFSGVCYPSDGAATVGKGVPDYSTDIAATWQVVEKMKDHPHVNRRALQLVAWEYGRTYAAFSNESPDFGLVTWSEGSGPHATPLAICRAALAAVDQ